MLDKSQSAQFLDRVITTALLLMAGSGCGASSANPPQMIFDPHQARCNLTQERMVFVSRQTIQGANLRGIVKDNAPRLYADEQCRIWGQGSDHHKDEYKNKKWAAWLSIPAINGAPGYSALDRITSRITESGKPWSIRYGEDCATVFTNAEALMRHPQLAIDRDEESNPVLPQQTMPAFVWTGTDSNGRTATASLPPQCVDKNGDVWNDPSAKGVYGSVGDPANWSNALGNVAQLALLDCSQPAHLYCFEVDKD